MDHHQVLSGHLLNAAVLVTAAIVALAAERVSAGPTGPARPSGVPAIGDIAGFIAASAESAAASRPGSDLPAEPFEPTVELAAPISVASPAGTPTVTGGRARRLTAILVADERPVAVVDDEVVSVGDVLRDGARVARIQSNRVFVVEKNGKWRTLTLAGTP